MTTARIYVTDPETGDQVTIPELAARHRPKAKPLSDAERRVVIAQLHATPAGRLSCALFKDYGRARA